MKQACEELLSAWDNAGNDGRDQITIEFPELAAAIEGIREFIRPAEYTAMLERLGESSK